MTGQGVIAATRALACGGLLAMLLAPGALRAEDFKTLLDAAWAAREPAQAALAARSAQARAGRDAAAAWWPGAPALTLAGRSDHVGSNRGQREWEAELSLPLWQPGQRSRAQASAAAQFEEVGAAARHARWALAGELREAWWALRLAEAEQQLALQRLAQAQATLDDVQARTRAGDSTPLDQTLAAAERTRAAVEATQAGLTTGSAARLFAALARGAAPPRQAELPAAAGAPTAGTGRVAAMTAATTATTPFDLELDVHPEAAAQRARIEALRRRVAQAAGEARAPLELALGASRERDGATEPWQQRTRVAIRVPLGGERQNRPRVAELQAELTAAEAALDDWRARHAAALAAARSELTASREAATLLAERAALMQQALAWVQQAHRAGQFDLPRLLRTTAEAADARARAERARIEAARAVSRWNQTLGELP